MAMMKIPLYVQHLTMRKWIYFDVSRIFPFESFTLPEHSVFHYLPEGETDLGPLASDIAFRDIEKTIYVHHITQYSRPEEQLEGKPRTIVFPADREIRNFHRQQRILRRHKRVETSIAMPKNLLVYNYALIRHGYRYPVMLRTEYYKNVNFFNTLVDTVKTAVKETQRLQFLRFRLPEVLLKRNQLLMLEKKLDNQKMAWIADFNQFVIYQLWLFLNTEKRNDSLFNQFTDKEMESIYLVYENEKWFSIRLDILKNFSLTKDEDGDMKPVNQVRLKFLDILNTVHNHEAAITPVATEEVSTDHLDTPDDDDTPQKTSSDEDEEETPSSSLDKQVMDDEETSDEDVVIHDSVIDQVNVPSVVELKAKKPKSPKEATTEIVHRIAETKRLSTAEIKRGEKIAGLYQSIKNPFGAGSLEQFRQVKNEDKVIDPKAMEVVGKKPVIFDDDLRYSSTQKVRKQYVDKMFHKDVVNHVLAVHNVGIGVQNYEVEKVSNILGDYEHHSVQVVPVVGAPSTLHFKIPKIDEDETFKVGGVRYYIKWQRMDVPVRKINEYTVALTTYYPNKVFVQRSQKVVNNFENWFTLQIIEASKRKEKPIEDLRYGHNFNPKHSLPRLYTLLAKRFLGFKVGEYTFYFNYDKRASFFGEKYSTLELGNRVCVAKGFESTVVMDDHGNLIEVFHNKKGEHPLPTLAELMEIPLEKAPMDVAEMRILKKMLPLGFVLAYYMGYRNLVKLLGVKPRVVPTGQRVGLQPFEFMIRFMDETHVFTTDNPLANLILGGLTVFEKDIRRYSAREYDKRDVYKTLLENRGMGVRYTRELELLQSMFIDPISQEILASRKEPVIFDALLVFAAELLLRDEYPEENSLDYQRFRGSERFTGIVYQEMVRSIRRYQSNPVTSRAKLELNPESVWMGILNDTGTGIVKENNPIHNLREQSETTFGGVGGRDGSTLVVRSRMYNQTDLGTISEATVDSGKVGVTTYLSGNPNFTDARGMTRRLSETDGISTLFSPSLLYLPSSDKDDPKRSNFSSIQYGSTIATKGYHPQVVSTGYDRVTAGRVDKIYAKLADMDGQVIDKTDDFLLVQYKDGKVESLPINRYFGTSAGSVVPHQIETRLKKGDRFKKEAILTWNSDFYDVDFFDSNSLVLKAGVKIDTVFWESPDTLEDSSAISPKAAELLMSNTTKLAQIVVDFSQGIQKLVKVGQDVEVDTPLCFIEDSVSAATDLFSTDSTALLKKIGSKAPKAKMKGTIERIEVFYNGELGDMSETLKSIAKQSDQRIKAYYKAKGEKISSGQVDNNMRIKNKPLVTNQAVINIYITGPLPAGVADKVVFSHQLKSVIRDVFYYPLRTEHGKSIDAIFGFRSVDARIVGSANEIGTAMLILDTLKERVLAAYDQ